VVGAGDERGADRRAGFTSEDRVRDVLHNFNADGFESLKAVEELVTGDGLIIPSR